MTNQQPIKPVFRGVRYHGESIEGDYYNDPEVDQSYIVEYENNTPHAVKPETLQISLDGENFYSMEFVREAIEDYKRKRIPPCLMCSKLEKCDEIHKSKDWICFVTREFRGSDNEQ